MSVAIAAAEAPARSLIEVLAGQPQVLPESARRQATGPPCFVRPACPEYGEIFDVFAATTGEHCHLAVVPDTLRREPEIHYEDS